MIVGIRNSIVEYNVQFKMTTSGSEAQKILSRYFVKQIKDDPFSSPLK